LGRVWRSSGAETGPKTGEWSERRRFNVRAQAFIRVEAFVRVEAESRWGTGFGFRVGSGTASAGDDSAGRSRCRSGCPGTAFSGYTDMAPVDRPEFQQRWIADAPRRRAAMPEEIAPSVVCLASDASAFMTGSVL
jgi:enoyl-ACP reductase-like protein